MRTMHPTLLVGPADWDRALLPEDEFLDRIARFWAACDPKLSGAIVYGSPRQHAELAYLTHFTPKLEPAIALIPRKGEPGLLVGGGANMLGAAKPLTWVEQLLPLREAGAAIASWAAETGSVAMINAAAMPSGLHKTIANALGADPPDVSAIVAAAMRQKSAREMALMRAACATLDAAVMAMRQAHDAGRSATDVVLAGEHAAWRRGAQDVRTLFGPNGTLRPFANPIAEPIEPLQVYMAVRHGGYWAEGFAVLSRSVPPAARRASEILQAAIAAARPGASHRALARLIAQETGAAGRHPVTSGDFGGSIGLQPEEPHRVSETSDGALASGEVYTLRVGLVDNGACAVASAMLAIGDHGGEVLWPAQA